MLKSYVTKTKINFSLLSKEIHTMMLFVCRNNSGISVCYFEETYINNDASYKNKKKN